LAKKTTITEVKAGMTSVEDLMKLNALMDMQDSYQDQAMKKKD